MPKRKRGEAASATETTTGDSDLAAATLSTILSSIHPSWAAVAVSESKKPYFSALQRFVADARRRGTVFPPAEAMFTALRLTSLEDVRVVVLGQDPYHGRGQAHGLAFSVEHGVAPPPSLLNILKEAHADVGGILGTDGKPAHGHLGHWARQGVFLLNTVLTVESGKAGSHQNNGWEAFTSALLSAVAERHPDVVYMLWGKPAQSKRELLDASRHSKTVLVLEAPHPSPLSAHRGFFGCRHFSKANAYLVGKGKGAIDWGLQSNGSSSSSNSRSSSSGSQ